jgi:tetratricopeptide (TPR) repeat protein
MREFRIFIFFILTASFCQSQNKYTDSLTEIAATSADTIRIKAVFSLFEYYQYSDQKSARKYLTQMESMALRLNIPRHIASTYIYYGNHFDDNGDTDSALYYYSKALDYSRKNGLRSREASAYNGLGGIYMRRGEYPVAMNNYMSGLRIYEGLGNKNGEASCLNNLGLLCQYTGKQEKALEYFMKSLKIKEELGEPASLCNSYNNIGLFHYEQSRYEEAKKYFNRALSIARTNTDSSAVAMLLGNIGMVYNEQGNVTDALKYFESSLKLYQDLGNKAGEATILTNMSAPYHRLKQDEKCIELNLNAMRIFRELGSRDWVAEIYEKLYQVYAQAKKYEEAFMYHVLYMELKDSLYTEESNKALAEIETKYESEKKQKEIELLNQKAQVQEVQMNKNKVILYAFIVGFILILMLSLLLYNRYKLKRTANLKLEQQNQEISDQKTLIEQKNKDITDSILYAKRLQEAILPSDAVIKGGLPESFVLFRPKDIVSGDFYYFNQPDTDTVVLAAADCTGHGVPGAFMSILGFNALEHAINVDHAREPSDILNRINAIISTTLNQNSNERNVKDGMDIALCSIDRKSNQIKFSGANNPLWLISNNELIEFKASKKPIGVYEGKDQSFACHTIQLKAGDSAYLFSDGFADQFGGPQGKKFKYRQMKELLQGINSLPMKDQQKALELAMDSWMGDLEQVDDILIIGFRL